MAKLKTDKQEGLARGVANGLSFPEAGKAAGYKEGGRDRLRKTWEDEPAFVARVAEFKAEIEARLELDGSNDLRPVICELMAAARKAVELASGVGMRAAAEMYAEAARLKQTLARQAPSPELVPELTREEWLTLFAPPKPESVEPA